MTRSTILLVLLWIMMFRMDDLNAFSPSRRPYFSTRSNQENLHKMKVNANIASSEEVVVSNEKVCLWKKPGRWWEQRININDLKVGQNLTGIIVQELLTGKTGPKGTLHRRDISISIYILTVK